MYPQDKRAIEHLLDDGHPDKVGGFWHMNFDWFDQQGLNTDTAGKIAAACEREARRILEEHAP